MVLNLKQKGTKVVIKFAVNMGSGGDLMLLQKAFLS